MADVEFTTGELATEEWRPVVGWETHYAVSSLGRIKRMAPARGVTVGRILVPYPNKSNGYSYVSLHRNGHGKLMRVHRLVTLAFLGPRPDGLEVNHVNGRKTDSRLANLEYVTHSENVKHGYDIGLSQPLRGDANPSRRFPHLLPRGSRHGMSKLTEADVSIIRSRRALGESCQAIANSIGISRTVVGNIVRRKAWTHVP